MLRAGLYDHHVPMRGFPPSTANASGVAVANLGPCPEGYCWYVERVSVHCPTSAAKAELYVSPEPMRTDSTPDLGMRADFTQAGADDTSDNASPIYVPPGYYLVARWSAATNGDACVAGAQYSVHQIDPRVLMSPEDIAQVRASREHAHSPLTEPATASERAV